MPDSPYQDYHIAREKAHCGNMSTVGALLEQRLSVGLQPFIC